MSDATKSILVTGDVTVHHHIYKGSRDKPSSASTMGTDQKSSFGGARLTYELLSHLGRVAPIKTANDIEDLDTTAEYSVEFGLSSGSLDNLPSHLHRYEIWEPCRRAEGTKERVWRLKDSLGYGRLVENTFVPTPDTKSVEKAANILVLDDGGLGFRIDTSRNAWPRAIRDGNAEPPDWIVLKMDAPVADGDLWREVTSDRLVRKTVALFSIDDIRSEEVRITSGISWERTALDLVHEIGHHPILRSVMRCRHCIVLFGVEGALHFDASSAESPMFRLAFDPERLEGDWSDAADGQIAGDMNCLAAAVAAHLAMGKGDKAIEAGIQSGIAAMRSMFQEGHGPVEQPDPRKRLSTIESEILCPSMRLACNAVPGPDEIGEAEFWTFIAGRAKSPVRYRKPLMGAARRVALLGPRALRGIPYQRFGKLFTVDRSEIESLRNLQELMARYQKIDRGEKPLSIAVFGAPGSGKSFSVKQIARAVLGENTPILEFNLSQFSGTDELVDALHVVRDKVLEGPLPVVFWDEFDSQEYKWLQYLLAPMQDGSFREGQLVHPIGKCVFVFAGGTSYDFENFGPSSTEKAEYAEFRLKKGPDFKSRLSGYLNVLGPNPRQRFDGSTSVWIDDESDICYPVRRALLLRVMLQHYDDEPLSIDRGVLSALLEIDRYKHGARSMEKIISALRNRGMQGVVRRSDLPPAELMSMHADHDEFMAIANRELRFQMDVEPVAEQYHEFYRKAATRRKKKYALPFHELPNEIQEENRAAARRIPHVLGLVGLYVTSQDTPVGDSRGEIQEIIDDNIELLAEAEHKGWMEHRMRNGWRYGKQRNDKKRISNCLKPYEELNESTKKLDRETVGNYWDILDAGGYKIVTSLSQDA